MQSQRSVAASTMSTTGPLQLGGNLQPVGAERAMNGFTAVNDRTSPTSQPQKQPTKGDERDDASQALQESTRRPAGGTGEQNRHERSNGTSDQTDSSLTNGEQKSKRSLEDVDDERSTSARYCSSRSPDSAPEDVHTQEASSHPPPSTEQAANSWNAPPSDEHAGNVHTPAPIQRNNQQHVNGNFAPGSPLPNGHGMRPGYRKDENMALITTNAGVQMDPRKRKRAFKNRTRTGCQTCRKRKKKCDEEKPECKNCTRGGFRCEGYAPRVSWPPDNKSNGSKQPVQPPQVLPAAPRALQELSENLHPRPPAGPQMQPGMITSGAGHANIRPRPILLDGESERPHTNGWHHQYDTSYRPYSETKDSVHGLPLNGVRDSYDRPTSSMGMGGPYPAMPMLPAAPQASHGAVRMAQEALHAYNDRPPPGSYELGEKDTEIEGPETKKMFRGELYAPLSRELQSFREETAGLLLKFNQNYHSSPEERGRQLDAVLNPDSSRRRFSAIPLQVKGRKGENTSIEVPFKCEYGTNIKLGDNVYIEGGCHIVDPREVYIGSATQIGAGVKIVGKFVPFDPKLRWPRLLSPHSEGKVRGVRIIIGKNVYIGADTVIQPEAEVDALEIGDNAYIKPGSIVSRNVPKDVLFGPTHQSCGVLSYFFSSDAHQSG